MERRDLFRAAGLSLLFGAETNAQNSRIRELSDANRAFEKRGKRLVLDLTGRWRLAMDDRDVGLKNDWFAKLPLATQARRFDVVVPSVWQQYLEIQGAVGWYYKDLQIPRDLIGKVLRLHFEAIDYRARVWFNGEEVGSHDGGFTPFELDVSRVAKAGTNRLVVRVSDVGRDFRMAYCGLPGWEKTRNGTVDGLSFAEIPAGFQDWREGFDHGGIWQPVNLIATEPVYVADLFLVPNVAKGSVEARVTVINRTERTSEASVTVQARPWKGAGGSAGGDTLKVRLEPGQTSVNLQIKLSQPHAWSVTDPFLYVADASVQFGSEVADDFGARFGLREFTVGSNGAFHLNGEEIFIKGAHYQSTEPITLAFPRSVDAARQIVEIAKEGGFNFIRGQGRPTVTSILDAADELGMLFQCEPAVSKMADNSGMEALAEREVTDMVRRDRNHPSVVIWNMINEQAAGMKVVERMCHIARTFRPHAADYGIGWRQLALLSTGQGRRRIVFN